MSDRICPGCGKVIGDDDTILHQNATDTYWHITCHDFDQHRKNRRVPVRVTDSYPAINYTITPRRFMLEIPVEALANLTPDAQTRMLNMLNAWIIEHKPKVVKADKPEPFLGEAHQSDLEQSHAESTIKDLRQEGMMPTTTTTTTTTTAPVDAVADAPIALRDILFDAREKCAMAEKERDAARAELAAERERAEKTAASLHDALACTGIALNVEREKNTKIEFEWAALDKLHSAVCDERDAARAEVERLSKGFHESCIVKQESLQAALAAADATADKLAALLLDARDLVEECVQEHAASWGERLMHKQLPAIETLRQIDAALAAHDETKGKPCQPK